MAITAVFYFLFFYFFIADELPSPPHTHTRGARIENDSNLQLIYGWYLSISLTPSCDGNNLTQHVLFLLRTQFTNDDSVDS